MDWGHTVSLTMLLVTLVLTAFTELKDGRIPDWITLPALLVGFLVGYLEGGITLGSSVGGFVVGFGFLFIFYMFGGMGGGDVKLMGAVGALMGYPAILPILMYTAFVGGAMAVILLIWRRQFWQGLARSCTMLFSWRKGPSLDDVEAEAAAGGEAASGREDGEGRQDEGGDAEAAPGRERLTIPYGLAIIAGCMMHMFLQTERLAR